MPLHNQRWRTAVGFRGEDFLRFGADYFTDTSRRILLIAGAGFDPRSTRVATQLTAWANGRINAIVVREERPTPAADLRALADRNASQFRALIPSLTVEVVPIFDALGSAVIGGRQAANVAANAKLDGVTDVVVDVSGLSVGTSFPIIAVLLSRAESESKNLHAIVAADSLLDAEIVPEPTEAATLIHGFRGELGLDKTAKSAKLWLPQLAPNRRALLDRAFRELAPHDICPILPFPAQEPRAGDELVDEYLAELDGVWGVDTRNFIHAADDDPLDVYRTILDLSEAREPVFRGHGGELYVLSPLGSKVLALGALMAAFERQFAVLHVEAIAFTADAGKLGAYPAERSVFAHVWLVGDPYPVDPPVAQGSVPL